MNYEGHKADYELPTRVYRFDPQTGKLQSRSRISGPKLTVDLRPEVSKMLIEGTGYLQLEDFREKPQPDVEQVLRGDGRVVAA